MGRKNRSANNNVKRERMAVRELARLKKCLGLVDEKGNSSIMEKVADISTPTTAKAIKKKQLEEDLQLAMEEEEELSTEKMKVTNEKTGVEHVYDPKTKKDQFGNYPVWYNRQAEKKKKRGRNPNGSRRGNKRLTSHSVSLF